MAERASVTQGFYLGPESSPGDGGADFKILNGIDLEPGVKVDMQRFRPVGTKLETIIVPGKEWSEFDLSGVAQYSELHYLFSGVYGANAVSQPTGPTDEAYAWNYILSARAPDEVQTYGAVKGDDNYAESYSYLLMTELGMELSREGIKLDGNAIGHEAEFNANLPHPVTSIEEVPILPTEVSVYLDDEYAHMGGNKLLRAFMVKQTIGDRHNPVWVLDADEPSFVTHVELAPKFEFEVTLEADAQGKTVIDAMRGGDTNYLRVTAESGSVVGSGTTPYSLEMDAAVKVAEVDKFSDEDGVYAIKYTFAAVSDAENDLSVETTLINGASTF